MGSVHSSAIVRKTDGKDTFVCRATCTKDCVLLDGYARSVDRRGVGEVRNPRLQSVAVVNASPPLWTIHSTATALCGLALWVVQWSELHVPFAPSDVEDALLPDVVVGHAHIMYAGHALAYLLCHALP